MTNNVLVRDKEDDKDILPTPTIGDDTPLALVMIDFELVKDKLLEKISQIKVAKKTQ